MSIRPTLLDHIQTLCTTLSIHGELVGFTDPPTIRLDSAEQVEQVADHFDAGTSLLDGRTWATVTIAGQRVAFVSPEPVAVRS